MPNAFGYNTPEKTDGQQPKFSPPRGWSLFGFLRIFHSDKNGVTGTLQTPSQIKASHASLQGQTPKAGT